MFLERDERENFKDRRNLNLCVGQVLRRKEIARQKM
jgi:hypothetical protein